MRGGNDMERKRGEEFSYSHLEGEGKLQRSKDKRDEDAVP